MRGTQFDTLQGLPGNDLPRKVHYPYFTTWKRRAGVITAWLSRLYTGLGMHLVIYFDNVKKRWSQPSPVCSINYNSTCSPRNVSLTLFWEKERPRLFVESWRKLPNSSQNSFSQSFWKLLIINSNCANHHYQNTTRTIFQTIISNHVQLALDRSHFSRSHFFLLAIPSVIANQSMGHE